MSTLRFRKSIPLVGGLLALVLVVASACGGGGSAKAVSASPTTAAASTTAFISCLKSHGYSPPQAFIDRLNRPPTTDTNGGGGFGGGGGGAGGGGNTPRTTLDPAQAQARTSALQSCQSLAPAGARGFGNPGGGAARLTAYRTYASCLSDHGYPKLLAALPPAPAAGQTTTSGVPGAFGGLRQAIQSIDRSDPAFVNADSFCKPLAPANGPGVPGGANSSPTSTTAAPAGA